ncbi:MAG: glycosyltransferase family 8 protein [Nitrospira sp.]|nr:glycosyltransferase family 8 protein [Nitrospira sp.]
MQLATTLRSIVENNQTNWPLEVYVLSDGFSEITRAKVLDSLPRGAALIHWMPVSLGMFQEFSTLPYISKMTYVRLLLPQLVTQSVSRVLYLDADLLVLDDLTSLMKTDLEGTVVGAVLDRWDWQIKRREPGLENVPRVRDYFNAGVLLINLERWRKERISEKALEYLVQYPLTPFADQDALNVACDGLWTKLDPRWNFHDHCDKRILNMEPEQRPGVLHFAGPQKPWNSSVPNINASFYDTFRRRTCFARTLGEKVWDILQGGWFHIKEILRRSEILRQAWRCIRHPLLR